MYQVKLKDVKKGEFFALRAVGEADAARMEKLVRVKGEYDRSLRKYEVWKFTDVNDTSYYKGDKLVYVGFTF